ncbi:MAG: matrixin family metalloprotease [Persicimonas sp.]
MPLTQRITVLPAFAVLVALVAGLAAFGLQPSAAAAFEPTMTCSDDGGPYPCEPGESPKQVRWPRNCVSFHINRDGSANVAGETAGLSDDLEAVVVEAFDRWDRVECSHLQLLYAGRTDNAAAEVTEDDAKNMNLIVWRDEDWPSSASNMALAVTSVTFDTSNGKIVDADVEFNSATHDFSTSTPPKPNHTDLLNTLVHEVGHFIGLDHTPVSEATMYASAAEGETKKRTLEQDDIDGICYIYPVEDEDAQCAPEDGLNGSEPDSGGGSDPEESGCGCAATRPSVPAGWLVVALAGLAGLGVRRRRRS